MDIEILISFVLASLALACSPGPDNIFVLMQGMVHGKKYGLATTAGLMLGCYVHTTLVAFGVSAIMQQNEKLFFAVKAFGAAYLIYLAYKVYQAGDAIDLGSEGSVQKKSYSELFKQGFLMNVLNPKVSIFFLAFFPGFLFSESLSDVAQFYILGTLFILVSGIVFSSIAILAGGISSYIKTNPKVGAYLKWLQSIVFVLIAIFILKP